MATAARLAALLSFGLAVCGLAAAPAGAAAPPRPTTLFASPTGAGSGCTAAAPCSLGSAAAKVRGLDRNMTADIDVDLYGGDYRLTDPLQLGPQDSGSNGFQVVYRPVRDQQPVLNGAVRVGGFTPVGGGSGIWEAPVPASAVATGGQQLFVDGTRATLARSAGSPASLQTTATGFRTSDASYAGFTDQSQIEVVQDNDWKHMSCPVQSITADPAGGSDINVLPSCWNANHVDVPNLGFPFNGAGLPAMDGVSYVENAYQLLSRPGQFYLDKTADRLYYIPLPGQDMYSVDVELPVLQTLVSLNGTPGHLSPVPENAPGATYTGSSWGTSAGRTYGDLGSTVAYATADGDSVSYTFTGSGVEVLGETNTDEGSFSASVDGVPDTRQNWTGYGSTRLAQQVLYSVQGLTPGTHTVTLTKTGGSYLVINAFEATPQAVAPVHDIAFQGIGFAYSTWNLPLTTGYIDNQAGVLWNTSGPVTTPLVTPGAVAVSRGDDITFSGDSFSHLGATGVDLADGTQNSTVTGSTVTDTAAGGISVGDVDDYFQNDPALMNDGDTVSDDTISHVGQDYTDAVGVWAGYTRDLTIDHNDIGHTSYSGMSLGWGWGWASPCSMQAAEGLSSCAHGTNYAGGNRITDNYVHDVMNVLYDGGPIYTNGGQGEDGARDRLGLLRQLPRPSATTPTTWSTRTRAAPTGTPSTTSPAWAAATGSACGRRRSTTSPSARPTTPTTRTRTTTAPTSPTPRPPWSARAPGPPPRWRSCTAPDRSRPHRRPGWSTTTANCSTTPATGAPPAPPAVTTSTAPPPRGLRSRSPSPAAASRWSPPRDRARAAPRC